MVDRRDGLPSRIPLPGVTSTFSAAAGFFFTTKGSANFGAPAVYGIGVA